MRIGISAIGINHCAGTGRHVSQLIRHLAAIDRINEYTVFLSPGQMEDLKDIRGADAVSWRIIPWNFQGAISGTIWNFTELYKKLRKERFDLIHFPEINRCLMPRYCPILVTAHGLIAFRIKNKDGVARAFYHNRIIPIALSLNPAVSVTK